MVRPTGIMDYWGKNIQEGITQPAGGRHVHLQGRYLGYSFEFKCRKNWTGDKDSVLKETGSGGATQKAHNTQRWCKDNTIEDNSNNDQAGGTGRPGKEVEGALGNGPIQHGK